MLNKKYSAYTLKIIALLFMILDHIHTYLNFGPNWISILPRFVAPLFTFLLVEGFFKTSSRENYFKRTFFFAVIMQIGNVLINFIFKNTDPFTGKMTFYSLIQGNNIFLTLAVFLLIMMMLENIRANKNRMHSLILLALLSFSVLFTEGGVYLYLILLIMYFYYGDLKKIAIGITAWCLLLFIKTIYSYMNMPADISLISTFSFSAEWAMIFVLLPIYLYSGERGKNTPFAKWFFYLIYPLHLWILYIINYLYI